MFIITGGRQSGKTNAAMRWLLEAPSYRCVIVANNDRRNYLIRKIKEYHPNYAWERHILTASDLTWGVAGRFEVFAIDDLEEVLSVMFRIRIDFVTANATWIPLAPTTDTIRAQTIQPDPVLEAEEIPFDVPPGTQRRKELL